MSDQVEKYDEFGDLSLSVGKDENSNLDEYGVWIKKKPNTDEEMDLNELHSDDGGASVAEEGKKDVPFDFDGLDENDSSCVDSLEKELKETEQVSDVSSSSSDFDDVDMSNFFTDLGSSVEIEESTKKEDEEALKMDLNFDTVDSYVDEENKDDLDDILNITDSSSDPELDDFLSDLNSSTSPSISKVSSDSVDNFTEENVEFDVYADENQDFSNIGQTTDSEESVVLPVPVSEIDETTKEKKIEDSVIIKNTIVEPENIEEIREENRKVMGEEGVKKEDSFNDIEALANDLTSGVSSIANNFVASSGTSISVEGIDKITDLLTDIVKEISSLKNEISTLKAASRFVHDDEHSSSDKNVEQEEATGFFKDEDTDEAIALTGDELNNILITADFTEEDEPSTKVADTVDEDMGTCEVCSDDGQESIEDDFSSEKDVDFDDITLENSKLDDFVIPEELDYSMLNNDDEVASTEGSDMSYLDEKNTEDEVSVDIPETQEISVEESQNEADFSNVESSETLPSNIKKDVKSVLAYMDQLLESLPEDKMKEFAESEYFEMYNRLFSELGIS